MSQKSKTEFQTITSNQVASTKGCNAVMFENKGDVDFFVNGYRISCHDSPLCISQHDGCEDITVYHVSFDVAANSENNPQCGVISTYPSNY